MVDTIKIWLDDKRPPPDDSWVWAKDSRSAVNYLLNNKVELISFDHDLGEEDTAMRVIDWLDGMTPYHVPKAYQIHSQNPVGRENIRQAMERIIERYENR